MRHQVIGRRRCLAAIVLVTLASATWGAPASAQPAELQVAVLVRDRVSLAPEVIERARAVAVLIYGAIGVKMTWLDAGQFDSMMPDDSAARRRYCQSIVIVDLVPRRLEENRQWSELGFAIVGSSFARVFVHRIDDSTKGRFETFRAEILGYVIAHEVGHLLLRRSTHGVIGLMAPMLDQARAAQGALYFNSHEGALIRENLTNRTRSVTSPGRGPQDDK